MGTDYGLMRDLVAGMEHHNDLVEARGYLESAGKLFGLTTKVDGNEDFADSLKDVGGAIGSGLLKAGNWAGGKAFAALKAGFTGINKKLNFCFASNQTLIRKVSQGLSHTESEEEIEVSAELVALLTADGKIDSLDDSYKELSETCGIIKRHVDELNAYLEKGLSIIKRLNNVKNDTQALEVYEAFIALKHPKLELQNHQDNTYESSVLPGGKVITVTYKDKGNTVLYSMSGTKPSGVAGSLKMGKSELKSFVDKLNPINELHKTLVNANDKYLKFSSNWASAVKSAYEHLENVNSISSTVNKDLESMLRGDANCLAFYSGFTPRLSTYVNKYIHDVLNLVSKLI